jgi:transcriptional regulator with XRE-family HTH domain
MSVRRSPPLSVQAFSARLRRARQGAEISGRMLAARTGMTQSKISRIEMGLSLPTEVELESLCVGLHLDDSTAKSLMADLSICRRVWGRRRKVDRDNPTVRYCHTSERAVHNDVITALGIPSILHTPAYMYDQLSSIYTPEDLEMAAAARLSWQSTMHIRNRRFRVLAISDGFRTVTTDPAIHLRQLETIEAMQFPSSVEIRLLLKNQLSSPISGSMSVLDNKLVDVDSPSNFVAFHAFTAEPSAVKHARRLFDEHWKRGISGEALRSELRRIRNELREELVVDVDNWPPRPTFSVG